MTQPQTEVPPADPSNTSGKDGDKKESKAFKFMWYLHFLALSGVGYWAYNFFSDWPDPCKILFKLGADSVFVQEYIGTPYTTKLSMTGTWTGSVHDKSRATIKIPIKGPKSEGVLMAHMFYKESTSEWIAISLEVSVGENPRKFNMLEYGFKRVDPLSKESVPVPELDIGLSEAQHQRNSMLVHGSGDTDISHTSNVSGTSSNSDVGPSDDSSPTVDTSSDKEDDGLEKLH